MHILFITHEYPTAGFSQGGIGSVVHALAHALIQNGHHATVVGVGNYGSTYENDKGVEVYRLQRAKWRYASFFPNSQKLLKKIEQINIKKKIDVIEGSELDFAFFPKKYFIKRIIRMHGGHNFFSSTLSKKINAWRSFQEKRSFKRADALIAVSDFVGQMTLKLLGDTREYKRIYNLVNINKFIETSGEQPENNSLLFIGTVVEKKGIKQLIESMPLVLERFPDAKLNIVGRDTIDPETNESYSLKLQNSLDQEVKRSIEFVGMVEHKKIPTWLDKSEVCVYPSHMEAQGIVVVEAMAKAKPVIFSKTGPGTEMITHNINGLLCDPYDSKDIAEKIIALLEDKKYAKSLGEKAQEVTLERFSMNHIIKQNIEFYQKTIVR